VNVRGLLEVARDLDDAVAAFADVAGVTEAQFCLTPLGFWLWQPPDAETWERACAAYEAERQRAESAATHDKPTHPKQPAFVGDF